MSSEGALGRSEAFRGPQNPGIPQGHQGYQARGSLVAPWTSWAGAWGVKLAQDC